MKIEWRVLGGACVLVIGMYAYTAPLGKLESSVSNPAGTYYNLLVQGFRDGHLSVKKDVPVGLPQLADPYDPDANRRYQDLPYALRDMSYYKGRLYIYFGVTPVLILFWPFVALTGHYLFDRQAVTIFCAIGFLVSAGLLRAIWRRYFAEVSVWVVAVCTLALGIATGVPAILPRSDVQEVATSCGYMLMMLVLVLVWCALHEPERRGRWLAAASLIFGLALGARPNLLFGAIILLVPVLQAWRERRPILALLAAATGPISVIGLGLMLYNALRFDNPFEFGTHYELGPVRLVTHQFFSLDYLWFNFRVNFLEPARWSRRFPFVHEIALPPLPAGYIGVEDPFGILTNIPLVWLALAVPLAWRKRSDQERSACRWFVTAVALLVAVCALPVAFYCSASIRYEVDYLPALMLLAVIGILGCERALATPGPGLAEQPVRRRAVRWGWSVLLGFSVVFNVLVSIENYAYTGCSLARMLVARGQVLEAIRVFENSLRIKPDYAEGHIGLGKALCEAGMAQQAIQEEEYALRLNADYAESHYVYGVALQQLHKVPEAMVQYEQALQIDPSCAEAHNNLGSALVQTGKIAEAIAHYEQAVRINPDFAEAHFNLGNALVQSGKIADAIAQYEQAVRIKPDYAEAHCNLGIILGQSGRIPEAVEHLEQAVRIKPDSADNQCNLGIAFGLAGRTPEAIEHLRQALRLKPDFPEAQAALARLQAGQ